jgi:hypothetical protein
VPAQESADQGGLACSGAAEQGDVLPGRDDDVEIPQQPAAFRLDRDTPQLDRGAAATVASAPRFGWARDGGLRRCRLAGGFWSIRLLGGGEELCDAAPRGAVERQVPAGEEGEALAGGEQAGGPEHDRHCPEVEAMRAKVAEEQAGGGDREERLHGDLDQGAGELRVAPGAQPVGEGFVVAAAQCDLGAMSADGGSAAQKVEIEGAEGGGVGAHPTAALLGTRQEEERDDDGGETGGSCPAGERRVEPGDARGRGHGVEAGAQRGRGEVGTAAERPKKMRALGEIREQSAPQVRVGQAGQLCREAQA